MSGAPGKVPTPIHVGPDALGGAPLVSVRDGDPIRLDALSGTSQVLVDAIEWAARQRADLDADQARDNGHDVGHVPEAIVGPGTIRTPADAGPVKDAGCVFGVDPGHSLAACGLALLKAPAGPYPDIAFCPTGGLTADTAPAFLALPDMLVCGVSWRTPNDAIRARNWAQLTRLRGWLRRCACSGQWPERPRRLPSPLDRRRCGSGST